MEGLEWLFFDMGCTFMDETAAWSDRIARLLAAHPELTEEDVRAAMREGSENYISPWRYMVKKLGVGEKIPYDPTLERPFPGASELLFRLAGSYRLAVVANQDAGTEARLRGFGIRDCFEFVLSSAELGIEKPDPRIFRLALELSGAEPFRCCMTGDRLDNDVGPAKALGIRTVWIKGGLGGLQKPRSAAFEPDFTVSDFRGMEGIFLGG